MIAVLYVIYYQNREHIYGEKYQYWLEFCVLVIIFCVSRFTTMFPVRFTETLEVNNFAGTQEPDRIADVVVFY